MIMSFANCIVLLFNHGISETKVEMGLMKKKYDWFADNTDLKFVLKGPIKNKSESVQIMALHRIGPVYCRIYASFGRSK